ncbi:stalk domain-containing protein [Psychrobacillus sp. NPDC058041]|uniref:stalk domain-containing protein n=1 Tax=Psychrobacillus sp. NPDC058041 TaxID=3346310 RepID=UPI0036DE5A8F
MKKIGIFTVVLLLMVGFDFHQPFAKAQSEEEATLKQQDTSNFIKTSGIITDIVKQDETITLTVETQEKEPQITILKLTDNTLVFNSGTTKALKNETFKKGQKIDAYYDKNKPMIMIYPPQISPELVIINDNEKFGNVKVSKFDNKFVSLDNDLKLNIGKETIIVNEKGEKLDQKEITDKELVVFYTVSTRSIPAQTTPSKIIAIDYSAIELKQEDTTNYMKFSGIIKGIATQDGKAILTVDTEEKEPQTTIFTITDNTLLFNSGTTKTVKKETFKKGQRLDAYYDKNKPMILIYPAQITPELVIVQDEEKLGTVKVSKFDDEFLSLDKELKLNIGKETLLVNEKGEKIKQEDLKGKELVVFYTIMTMSIPAQTPPSKIVAINYLSPGMKEVLNIIEMDHFIQNGTKMIPLSKVAEQLGYEVKTNSKRFSTTLSLGNSTIKVTRGKKTYSYNKSIQQFKEKPVIKNNKIYVSEDILELLNQQ